MAYYVISVQEKVLPKSHFWMYFNILLSGTINKPFGKEEQRICALLCLLLLLFKGKTFLWELFNILVRGRSILERTFRNGALNGQ